MYTPRTARFVLALVLGVTACAPTRAQPSTRPGIAEVERQLHELRSERDRLQDGLRSLRQGAWGTGFLPGVMMDGHFKPLPYDDWPLAVRQGLVVPVSPQAVADHLATKLWEARAEAELVKLAQAALPATASDEDRRAVQTALARAENHLAYTRRYVRVGALALVRGAPLLNRREVLEDLRRAAQEYAARLAEVNAQIAALSAARARLLGVILASQPVDVVGPLGIYGASVWAGTGPTPVAPPAPEAPRLTGAGILKDGSGKPGAAFKLENPGDGVRLTIDYGTVQPGTGGKGGMTLTGVQDSYDPRSRVALFRIDLQFPKDILGGARMRGDATIDLVKDTLVTELKSVFDPARKEWLDIPKENWLKETHMVEWDARLEDRRLVSEAGRLTATGGQSTGEKSFAVTLQPGAHYTVELRAPAARLQVVYGKVGTRVSDRGGRTMRQPGQPARAVVSGPNKAEEFVITVIGAAKDLPARFELEVWERWRVNGNVPPLSWDSEYEK